ncbi:MAG: glycosyltransferase family 4 protein [Gemmatimonas sp.]
MTNHILVLHEGNPASGTRGGDVYWQHLFAELSATHELVYANREALGITGVVTGAQYATALERYLRDVKWRGAVLHDGSSFYSMTESNRMLKRHGWGPIISFMQEWVPARQDSFRMRLHLNRYMFRFLHSVDAHVAVSQWLRDRIRHLGVSGRRVDVARPGVPDACFESALHVHHVPSPRLRVISAGIYHPSKGQHVLAEAMGLLAARDPQAREHYEVNMFGAINATNQSYFDRLRERVRELALTDNVLLHGHISQQELFAAYAGSDVFAFTASGEGLALVVIESMMHGCIPVVARDSAMVELLGGGKLGVAVDHSPEALANALERIRNQLRIQSDWPVKVAQGARAEALTWTQAARACADRIRARIAER